MECKGRGGPSVKKGEKRNKTKKNCRRRTRAFLKEKKKKGCEKSLGELSTA